MTVPQVTKFTLYLMGIYICDCMLSLFSSVLYTIAATRCSCRLRTLVLRNMLRQDVAFFDTVRVGELLNRLSTDTEVIQSVVTANLAGWFIPLCQVIVGLVAIFTYNWKLTLVVLSLIPVIAVCMFLQGFCMKILTEQELIALAEAGSKADETLSNIRTVRSYVMEEKEIANYADRINVSFLIIKRRAWISGNMCLHLLPKPSSNVCCRHAGGGDQLVRRQLHPRGHVVRRPAHLPERNVSGRAGVLHVVCPAVRLRLQLPHLNLPAIHGGNRSQRPHLRAPRQVPPSKHKPNSLVFLSNQPRRRPEVNYDGGFIAPNGIEGHIEFQDVHFHYPSRPKVKVLNGLNAKLPAGKTMALVGSSGCGKSTIIYLIERFYNAQKGTIFVDKIDILKFDPQWLRDQIGLVQQEPILFAMTVEENIMYVTTSPHNVKL